MRQGGRLQAAIEVLEDVRTRHTPVNMALRDWGKAHRFAGSKDRAAIGNYVHDALRQTSSLGFRLNDDSARSLVLGAACFMAGLNAKALAESFKGDKFAPSAITPDELKKLAGAINLSDAPEWVQADVPDWLWPAFENNFGEQAITEGQALATRPPLDLRVNMLKSTQADMAKALAGFNARGSQLSPIGLRIPPASGEGRLPNIQIEAPYLEGQIEIQDEGSQLVSLLVNACSGERVLDFCAGGGGKSLALAAEMQNQGEVHAFDIDKRRLAPLYQRAQRAGADIITICQPPIGSLDGLKGQMDKVLIDAPCTGVGTWRRKPDAKWRLSEDALERRMKEQVTVLGDAKAYVRPGGLLFYVTCSMLAEENEGQIYRFLDENPDFTLLSAGEVWEERFGTEGLKPWSEDGCTLTLTPSATQTDGFFFAVMEKSHE